MSRFRRAVDALELERAEEALGPDNYRQWAKKCIERYAKNGQIVDAMIWGRIVALYEAELERKKETT